MQRRREPTRREKREADMRHRRRFEATCGLAAALVGFLNLAYALFVPTYAFQSGVGMFLWASHQSIWSRSVSSR